MSKAAKIAITIGLMVVWALLRSLLEYSDFPLPVLTFVFIIIILGIWAFGKNPNTTETDHSLLSKQENPEKQSDEKLSVGKPVAEIEIKPSIMKGIPYEQQLLKALRKACFPKNFMDPYDPDKVSIANELFQKLQAQDLFSEDIYSIRDRAVKELGITIDASFLFEELSAVCNPVNYMDPYDAEKVEISNGLYRKVLENKNDFLALEGLRKEAEERGLFPLSNDDHQNIQEATGTESSSDERNVDTPRIIVNLWKSVTGEYYRLVQYETSDLVFLEKEKNDLWVWESSLMKTKGSLYNGGFGSEYYNYDSPNITYKISLWNGTLIILTDGVESIKFKIAPPGEIRQKQLF